MVVPYSHELQALKQENKQLKDTLAKTQKENYILRGKLRNANATIETLQRELESTKNDLSSYIKSYNILWFENRDLKNNLSRLYNTCNQTVNLLVSKLNQTYNDYTNLTNRYNWLVETYNNLYQDYQTYKEGYETAMQRLYLIGIIAYASLSILLFAYLRVVRKYNKLLSEYDKLVEYLGIGEHERER
jgi:chromosome segregation ATPase